MDFEEWEPYYEGILQDFGYSRERDEASARILDEVMVGERIDPLVLGRMLEGKETFVAGNAESLEDELSSVRGLLIAADEAASVVRRAGLSPAIIVTDLDGDVAAQVEANSEGAVAVIHAHGDNMPAIEKHAPRFKGRVVGTTQGRPFGRVYNFGGFTDGDRAVFLAHHFHASRIRLVGFDFERPSRKDENPGTKVRKLRWARDLIGKLGVEI